MKSSSLLALDPGLNGTGWAFWRFAELWRCPTKIGVIKATDRKAEWPERAQDIAKQVRRLCEADTWVVSEFTEYHAAASSNMGWKTGDLQRLTFLCGVIAGRVHPVSFLPVTTSGWKGQLPKDVAAKRVAKILGAVTVARLGLPEIQRRSDTHAWDAVGIGLWALKHF